MEHGVRVGAWGEGWDMACALAMSVAAMFDAPGAVGPAAGSAARSEGLGSPRALQVEDLVVVGPAVVYTAPRGRKTSVLC